MINVQKIVSLFVALLMAIIGFVNSTISAIVSPETTPETSSAVITEPSEPTTKPSPSIPETSTKKEETTGFDYRLVPQYSGTAYYIVNNNIPYFEAKELTVTEPFENYSELDSLKRCGPGYANICKELIPTEERGDISSVKPSGWINKKYDNIDGGYLYNRCHIIGYQLAGENANELNLITGTRYMNVSGMLPFENMVADYMKEEVQNHVLYRVTPVFVGSELVCRGVLMEAYSVEDKGEGIEFCVFCYNVQPGITIDYATGDSHLTAVSVSQSESGYMVNTNTMKFHKVSCQYAQGVNKNQKYVKQTRDSLIAEGYAACKVCNP